MSALGEILLYKVGKGKHSIGDEKKGDDNNPKEKIEHFKI